MPGGAHEFLVITSEGNDAARWFNERGIAAFVLRYRLFRGKDSPYKFEHARQDAERAMRTIRAHAGEWKLDPHKIGVVGFSAGGELARVTLLSPPVPAPGKGDAIDRLSARPDFGVLVFPGPLHGEEKITRFAALADDRDQRRSMLLAADHRSAQRLSRRGCLVRAPYVRSRRARLQHGRDDADGQPAQLAGTDHRLDDRPRVARHMAAGKIGVIATLTLRQPPLGPSTGHAVPTPRVLSARRD